MSRDFELSSYQQDILDYVALNRGNLLIDAKAGSGKTSTLLLIADELLKANKNCLFLSFNKSIVEELQYKKPELADSIKTVHSLGLTFIRSYLYKKHGANYDVQVEGKKLRELCKAYYDKYFAERIKGLESEMSEQDLKALHGNLISDFVILCNFIRLYGMDYKDRKAIDYLTNRFCRDLYRYIDEDNLGDYWELVPAVLDKTIELFTNPPSTTPDGKPIYVIDYTDMIYFPVYFDMQVPYSIRNKIDTVLVDETQDLSQLQQLFVRKLNTGFNRFIFVGDRNQSIYGFNGADSKAVDRIKYNFSPKELPLSICYRCPQKIVMLAQKNVPDIEWNKDRDDVGVLDTYTYQEMKDSIRPGEIIIGRKNRDLLKIYRDFVLNDKRPVKFKNKEMVNAIIRDIGECVRNYQLLYQRGQNIDKFVYEHMDNWSKETGIVNKKNAVYKAELDNFITEYAKEHREDIKKKKIPKTNITLDFLNTCMQEYKDFGAYSYEDENAETVYFDVIQEFITEYKTKHASVLVKDYLDYIEEFLSASLDMYHVPIIGSIHSMKGGEADTIYIYDYPRFPYGWGDMTDEDRQQEENLEYVAVTRAKKNLHLVLIDVDTAKSPEQAKRFEEQNGDTISLVCSINEAVDKKTE